MKHFERGLPAGLLAALVLLLWPAPAGGQEQLAQLDSRPRFMQPAPPGGGAPREIDVTQVAMLRRRVSLNREGATVGEMLQEISRQSGLLFAYKADLLSLDRVVGLRADSITVAAALTEILVDAGVDVLLKSPRQAVLLRRSEPVQTGTVAGRVTDAKGEEAVPGAEVYLEGTRRRTTTGEDGRYRLAEVEAGNYTLAVRRIGYAKRSQAVTVASDEEITVDIALQPVPTQLNEIVTTVTGEQRLRELGHVVGRINADSLVKEAPVSNLSELLNGRVPGLQVFTAQGTVGGEVSLQVRSLNSVFLGSAPIVIVDGVRYTSGTDGNTGPFSAEPTSRLNDLNPNDIESIEVVKGPSAATLYGTDAANGVIVVTTKRGRPGPARWHAYGRATGTSIPKIEYPGNYWGWGTASANCRLQDVASGSCTQDSVTVLPNPLNDPDLTMFAPKPRWEYGTNVSGGRQDLRYYFSGDFERAVGPVQMPPAILEQLREQRGVAELPEEQRNPNAFTQASVRANVTAMLDDEVELRVNTGYSHSATRTLGLGSGPYSAGAPNDTPGDPYGGTASGPEEYFALTSTERMDRFFGSASGQWRPADWLTARATAGLDFASGNRVSLARRGEAPSLAFDGRAGDGRSKQLATTADVGVTASFRRGRLSSRTTIGAQYVRSLSDGTSTTGDGLPPGGESVGQALSKFTTLTYSESVTLGSYLEETVGLNERLFVTGALRADGASAFGQDYNAAVYPKASVSWIASEEPFLPRLPGLDELRLRYAFGASGQQGTPDMTLPWFSAGTALIDGATTTTVALDALGNRNLRPERVREHEFGLDATGLDGRFQVGLTWFRRTTTDQIVSGQLPPGLGFRFANLGRTTGHGFEAELRTQLFKTRPFTWDVAYQYALRRTVLNELGDLQPFAVYSGGYMEGYSLGARFEAVANYADANGDGIITASEVQVGERVYAGESTPPRSQTLTTVIGLFQRRLRLSALVERRSGFTQVNWTKASQCGLNLCRATVDPSTPLAEQAGAVAFIVPLERGDFTRLREVTAALDVPAPVLRALRLESATLSLAVRNLALWTSFSGPDPESATVHGLQGGVASGIPQGRSWTLRLDLGL